MSSKNRWSLSPAEAARRLNADAETVAQKITFELFRDVVLMSPVDTGRFRGNWTVARGNPDFTTSERTDKSASAAVAAEALNLPVGSIVWLANGLPYARALEYGHSKQAPHGMVRLSLARLYKHLRSATRK